MYETGNETSAGTTHLELLLAGDTPLLDVALETTDRVLGATHTLDLLARAVGRARVGHAEGGSAGTQQAEARGDSRVTTVAVGDELDEKWATLVVDGPLARVCSSLASRDNVHAVHLDTRDLVSALEVLRVHRAALRARAHTVLVVLANEHAR